MADASQAFTYLPDPQWQELGDGFSDPVRAADFPETKLRWRNDRAAAEVGMEKLDDDAWVAHFGRFEPLAGNLREPLALRYHGHQFRVYNPDLGDGRGFLFAQMRDRNGRLMDLGTKGSGTTPWSRRGDGRLTLKGAVRELLATEMLEARGVPTSRTFSIVETGEQLMRGDEPSPTRSAVLVRLSWGHIRIGSFQRLAYLGDRAATARLARYALRHYHGDAGAPGDTQPDDATVAEMLLGGVVARTADLAASYMVAGFVHGVLNSDNINISGESFDYGPWRFAPRWQHEFTAAYFDERGLYAFGRQPGAIHWNCVQLAQALLPLGLDRETAIAALDRFPVLYEAAMARRFLARMGRAAGNDATADSAIVAQAQRTLMTEDISIDDFFYRIASGRYAPVSDEGRALIAMLPPPSRPAPAGDESLLIEEVEAIWAAIAADDDWQPLYDKVARIRAMATTPAV